MQRRKLRPAVFLLSWLILRLNLIPRAVRDVEVTSNGTIFMKKNLIEVGLICAVMYARACTKRVLNVSCEVGKGTISRNIYLVFLSSISSRTAPQNETNNPTLDKEIKGLLSKFFFKLPKM